MKSNLKRGFLNISLFTVVLALTSCFGGGGNIEIDGLKGPTVSLEEDEVVIDVVFETIQIEDAFRYDIPKFPHSYLKASPDLETGGTALSIHLSLQDVLGDDVLLLPPQTLPGGRALPGVASGSLPAVAFTIPEFKNMTFYVGTKVFGVFLPYDIDLQGQILTSRFNIGSKKAGNISIVGQDSNGEFSGVLLLLDMKSAVKKKLMKIKNKFSRLR